MVIQPQAIYRISIPTYTLTYRCTLISRCNGFFLIAHAQNGSQSSVPPPVFTEPPPAYTDLECPKFKYSEDLPKYEDIVQHEQSRDQKIFATSSSAQFTLPGRSNFGFYVEDERQPSSSSSSSVPASPSLVVVDPSATSKLVVPSIPEDSVVSSAHIS